MAYDIYFFNYLDKIKVLNFLTKNSKKLQLSVVLICKRANK